MLSIFSSLYEMFIGENPDYPEYREKIFSSVGLLTLIIALVICLIFYAGLGRWKPLFHKLSHWVVTLIIVAVIGYVFAYVQSKNELGVTDSYVTRFSIFNSLFAAVYFIVFSLLLKRISIFAKRTPF